MYLTHCFRFDIQKRETDPNMNQVIDEDLIITFERKPSFAQKIKATRLQLPSSFYLYESKPPCSGCRGCDENFDKFSPKKIEIAKVTTTENIPPCVDLITTTTTAPLITSQPTFGSKSQAQFGGSTFAALASSSSSGFTAAASSNAFSGAGAQLFTSHRKEGDGKEEEDYDPQYEAIVQVTKLANIKTGEEDDEELFKHRAKLYRYDSQWKERGLGDIKLTKNAKTGYCRVIMRRDHIHKLCANHAIMPNMDINPLLTSDKSMVWFTPSDYSEGSPPVPQQFCVKFKYKHIADTFKEQFEICKQLMAVNLENASKEAKEEQLNDVTSTYETMPGEWDCLICLVRNSSNVDRCLSCDSAKCQPQENLDSGVKVVSTSGAPSLNFGISTIVDNSENDGNVNNLTAKFALKSGQWECRACLIRNEAGADRCVACETVNDTIQAINKVEFSSEKHGSFGAKFTLKPGQWECRVCLIRNEGGAERCVACETVNPTSSQDNEGEQNKKIGTTTDDKLGSDNAVFKFGTSEGVTSSPFSFGSSTFGSNAKPVFGNTESDFKFGSFTNSSLTEETAVKFPEVQKVTSPTKLEEEELDIHVEAIAQVTRLENTTTGEENDETIFTHRAKLFRFDSSAKQWKERGIGDIKLTRNKYDNKCRVLMRREQIHKLCANHAIIPMMELKPLNKSDKSWTWYTQADYSDGDVKPEQFCVKFKTPEIANEFKDSFEVCKGIVDNNKVPEAVQIKAEPLKPKDFKSMFAPKAGSWECSVCLIRNEESVSLCVACETANPNSSVDQSKNKVSTIFGAQTNTPDNLSAGFSFGSKQEKPDSSSAGFSFGSKPDKPDSSSAGFSFGSKQEKPDSSTAEFTFGSKQDKPDSTSAGFSFGAKQDKPDSSTAGFSFGSKQDKPDSSSAGFGFGAKQDKPDSSTAGFSFGSKPDKSVSPFIFGVTTSQPTASPFLFQKPSDTGTSTQSSFSFGQNQASKTELDKPNEALELSKFEADPNTWQCPSCLSMNNGLRECCRSCNSLKELFPVVRLDPKDFSAPINFQIQNAASQENTCLKPIIDSVVVHSSTTAVSFDSTSPDSDKSNVTSVLFINPNRSPSDKKTEKTIDSQETEKKIGAGIPTFEFSNSSVNDSNTAAFNFGQPKSESSNAGFSFLSNMDSNTSTGFSYGQTLADQPISDPAADRELMPPPKGLPIKVKGSAKANTKKASPKNESIFAWMPKGLSTDSLFSFGATPSPSLSAASSIDDLAGKSKDTDVLPAFSSMPFTFKLGEVEGEQQVTPTKPAFSATSPTSPKTPGDGDDTGDTTVEFTPIVTLSHVDNKTGEEEEEVLFSNRSKMFRFDGQWKERGVGEIRILRHKQNGQYRLIMRRDQTHKLCANHGLVNGMTIKEMAGTKKAYVWKSNSDISDGDVKDQLFAARFKDEEIASMFAEVFAEACSDVIVRNEEVVCENLPSTTHKTTLSKQEVIEISDSDSEEVTPVVRDEFEIVYEAIVDNNLKNKAREFLLPLMFYNVPSVAIGSVFPMKTHAKR